MADKPDRKAPATRPAQDTGGSNSPGHLGMDDRGNVTWEWKDEGDLMADDSLGAAERVRALADPGMDMLDDNDTRGDHPLTVHSKRLRTGYNPYNSGALGKQNWKKKRDLRQLSEWIKLRKKMADKGPGDES